MININEVIELLQSPNSNNLICRSLEFRPRNLAMFIANLSNLSNDYGYIVIGASKNRDSYLINGVSTGFRIDKPIKIAMDLLSEQPIIDYGQFTIDGKNVFIIKVNKIINSNFFKSGQNSESESELFIRDLYLACIKLQARRIYLNATEDERNDFITDLLDTNGYRLKDQTRRGSSAAGKSSGEVDIFVEKNGFPFTIIEALNLDSLNTNYLNTHLDKIYSYDTTGHKFNVCLSYVRVKDFGTFWERYCKHVKEHKYPVMLISSDEDIDKDYPFTNIRFMRTTHNRSGKITYLYHLCVKIHDL
ncbi:hypothetical protein ACVNNN_21485 [Lysinibacillus fusiformis]|uniref:hypothetical protein n=1 Tax=Lysinibacillus sp. PWR01 TaxID=3342384 RepID=UPI00372D33B4